MQQNVRDHGVSSRRGVWRGLAILIAVLSVAGAVPHATAQPAVAPAVPPAKTDPAPASAPVAEPVKNQQPAMTLSKGVIRHGRSTPIAKPAGAIRVATYNVENFFMKDQPAFGSGTPTLAKPVADRNAVAAAIRAIDADIIALEEMESKEALLAFRDEYLKDMGYAYVSSIDAGDGRGIEQSVLSRYPIASEENWPKTVLDTPHPEKLGKKPHPDAGKPITMARSPLRVTVQIPSQEKRADAKPMNITLFAVHHKSGPLYSYQRLAEGQKVVALAKEYQNKNPDDLVIVLGDFNARPGEPSVKAYTDHGFIDAFADKHTPDAKTGTGGEQPEFMTHVSGRAIDQLLLNPIAAKHLISETRFVLGTIQRLEHQDWRTTPTPDGYASDHYPVVVDLSQTAKP